MDDFFNDSEDEPEINELVTRFETMSRGKGFSFFDSEEFLDLADYYLMRANYRKLRQVLDMALSQYPSHIEIKVKQAIYYLRMNKVETAFDVLRKAEVDDPAHPEIFIARAYIYSTLRNHRKAIEEYEKALRNSDDPYTIYLNMSHEYEMLEDYQTAIKYVMKLIKMDPDNVSSLYELSYLINTSGDYLQGVELFNTYLDDNPYNFVGWMNLGLVYANLELFEKAIDAYDYAIAIEPTYGEVYYHKAIALMNLSDYEKAKQLLLHHSNYFEMDAELLALAECYEKTGDNENAIAHYTKLLNNEAMSAIANIGLSVCYEQMGKLQTAIIYARQAMKHADETPEPIYNLSQMLRLVDEMEEAAELYEQHFSTYSHDPEYYAEYALALGRANRMEEALDLLNLARPYYDQYVDLVYIKIVFLHIHGKRKESYSLISEFFSKVIFDENMLFEYGPILAEDSRLLRLIEKIKNQ